MNKSVTLKIRQIAEDITGDTATPIDVMRFRVKYGIAELHDYDVAKDIIVREYEARHGEQVSDDYASYGARYLLMPEAKFVENAERLDFNAVELVKIYGSVDITAIIYHLMYVYKGAMRRYMGSDKFRIFMPPDTEVHGAINIDLERKLLNQLASAPSGWATEASSLGIRSVLVWAYRISPNEAIVLYLPENGTDKAIINMEEPNA